MKNSKIKKLLCLIMSFCFCIFAAACSFPGMNNNENQEAVAQKDEVVSETTKDDELEKFKNMTSEEIRTQIFAPAETLFSKFDSTTLMCESETVEVNGNIYNAVSPTQTDLDETVNFSSYEAFKNYTKTIFSEEFTNRLFDEYERYINFNGKVYAILADRGGNLFYLSHTYAVTKTEKDKIEYTVYAKFIKEEYWDMYDSGTWAKEEDIPAYALETEEYIYPREKINGRWVFTDFCAIF